MIIQMKIPVNDIINILNSTILIDGVLKIIIIQQMSRSDKLIEFTHKIKNNIIDEISVTHF